MHSAVVNNSVEDFHIFTMFNYVSDFASFCVLYPPGADPLLLVLHGLFDAWLYIIRSVCWGKKDTQSEIAGEAKCSSLESSCTIRFIKQLLHIL